MIRSSIVFFGEYISTISNAAAVCVKSYGYILWGITDKNHKIVGSNINFNCSYKNEPRQNYLARSLNPSIAFDFKETIIEGNRIVCLVIPAAIKAPTSLNKARYGRISSNKLNLEKYSEREVII